MNNESFQFWIKFSIFFAKKSGQSEILQFSWRICLRFHAFSFLFFFGFCFCHPLTLRSLFLCLCDRGQSHGAFQVKSLYSVSEIECFEKERSGG